MHRRTVRLLTPWVVPTAMTSTMFTSEPSLIQLQAVRQVTTTWQLLIRFTSSRRRLLQLNSLQTTLRSSLLFGATGTTTAIGTTLESIFGLLQRTSGTVMWNRSLFLLQYPLVLTVCAFAQIILLPFQLQKAVRACRTVRYTITQ